ncbi:MAG: hypothetical protein GY711_01890 [bacterium]|nr:hypothetical protein [bacterium]
MKLGIFLITAASLLQIPSSATRVRTAARIAWQPSYEAAEKLALADDKVIFVAVNMDGERANDRIANETYKNKRIVKLSSSTVNLVGSIFDHKSGSNPCPRLGGVTCEQHREVEATLRKTHLAGGGEIISPQHFFLKPDGTVILSVPYALTDAELEWCFATAIRTLEPEFEWELHEEARPPKRLVMAGFTPEENAGPAPPTRAETLELVDRLKRNVVDKRGPAVNRVMTADEEEAIDFMKALMRKGAGAGPGKDIRPTLIHNMGVYSPPSYWVVMADYATSDDDRLRRESIAALEQLGSPDSVKGLRSALAKAKDPAIEADLIRALASAGATDKRTHKAVVKLATKDKDVTVRVGAVLGLGHLTQSDDVRELLTGLLKDGEETVRIAAVCAIGMTRDASWKDVLVDYSVDAKEPALQKAVRGALEAFDAGHLRPLADPVMRVAGDRVRRERFFGKGKVPK